MNGAFSLIKWGLTDCDNGLGKIENNNMCSRVLSGLDASSWTNGGNLSYFPDANTTSAAGVVSELSCLLTGGKLSEHSRNVIEEAYTAKLNKTGSPYDALKDAQQLLVAASEFHATNVNMPTESVRFTAATTLAERTTEKRPYKAIVYFFLNGAADSFNMLIPHSDCTTAVDLYDQYAEVRRFSLLTLSSAFMSLLFLFCPIAGSRWY